MDKLFVRSPYLHINKQENSNRSVLVNHLTARANVYNEKEKKLMEMGNTPCNLSLFINLFGEDTVKQWLQKKNIIRAGLNLEGKLCNTCRNRNKHRM